MANYGKQMEMFELGGLKDQGETIDKKSRNKVPVGSLKKEVRDDIPVNMSEGEFVLPADVVRYHGLEKIMGLRQQAKSGLNLMNDMGQMGNSHEATVPDDIPFKPNYQQGGTIVNPTIQQPEVIQQNQVPGVTYNQPAQMAMRPSIYNYAGQQPQVVKPPQVTVPTQPTYVPPQYKSPTGTAATPNYSQLVGASFGQMPKSETKRYFNKETGEEMYIPFVDGKPIYPIPAGFVEEAKAKADEAAKDPTKSRVDTARIMGESDDEQRKEPDTPEYKIASTLSKDKKGPITEALEKVMSFGPIKIVADKIKEQMPVDERFGGLFPADASQSKAMYDKEVDQNNALAIQAGYESYADLANSLGVKKPLFEFGTTAGTISRDTGKFFDETGGSSDWDSGQVAYASFQDFVDNLKASAKSGWHGGIGYSKQDYNKMNTAQQNIYKNHLTTLGKGLPSWMKDESEDLKKDDPKITDLKYKPDPRFRTGSETFEPSKKPNVAKAQAKAGRDRERIINRIKKEEASKKLKDQPPKVKPKAPPPAVNLKPTGSDSISPNVMSQGLTTASRDFDTSSFTGSDDYGDSGDDIGYGDTDADVGGWTAQGGFINKKKMTKKKVMKRGGLASRK